MGFVGRGNEWSWCKSVGTAAAGSTPAVSQSKRRSTKVSAPLDGGYGAVQFSLVSGDGQAYFLTPLKISGVICPGRIEAKPLFLLP